VDHDEGTFTVNERPVAQPAEKLFSVGRFQHRTQSIARLRFPNTRRHREKMKVMVAQHGGEPIPKAGRPPQHLERTGTAIHQIAHQPDSIRVAVEAKTLDETCQSKETTLDITDRVGSH
jgi:hypothetical protein